MAAVAGNKDRLPPSRALKIYGEKKR